MAMTVEQLESSLSRLPITFSDVAMPTLLKALPSASRGYILEAAISGATDDNILGSAVVGGNDFDLTPLLTNLASVATLYCAVVSTIEVILSRTGKEPDKDDVLSHLPQEQRQKPQAPIVVIFVLNDQQR